MKISHALYHAQAALTGLFGIGCLLLAVAGLLLLPSAVLDGPKTLDLPVVLLHLRLQII